MRLKWQDSENGAITKKAWVAVASSQIQYRQAGQKDIFTIDVVHAKTNCDIMKTIILSEIKRRGEVCNTE